MLKVAIIDSFLFLIWLNHYGCGSPLLYWFSKQSIKIDAIAEKLISMTVSAKNLSLFNIVGSSNKVS